MARPHVDLTDCVDSYDIAKQLAVDRGQSCIILDVGTDEHRLPVKSLRHIRREIFEYILPHKNCLSANKLYIIGRWNFSFDHEEELEQALDEAGDPWTAIYPPPKSNSSGKNKLTLTKERTVTLEEDEWSQGGALVCDLIRSLPNLTELTWITTDFPFTGTVWPVLPPGLKKLVLDIGQPVKVHAADFGRQTYISRDAMQPLTRYSNLEELRLFNMRDSFQSIVWETVFRATTSSKVVKLLDLQMAMKPAVRKGYHWFDVGRVGQSHVISKSGIGEGDFYRGQDGRGTLHHLFGHGEYLDHKAIRKARLATNLAEKEVVSLLCLRLDGFVIDRYPFARAAHHDVPELGSLALLVCGPKCIDAGLRAPRTSSPSRAWDHMVGNAATTHCMIKWPNWTGVFDAAGHQLDAKGRFVGIEKRRKQMAWENCDPMDFLKELTRQLRVVNPDDALRLSKQANSPDLSSRTSDPDTKTLLPGTPLSGLSNVSVRGSPVPLSSMAMRWAKARRSVTFKDAVMHDASLDNVSPASTLGDSEDPRPSAAGSTGSDTPDDKGDSEDDWERIDLHDL